MDHSHRGSGSTPSNSYFWPLGVLPVLLYHFCGSSSYEHSQCLFLNSLGVLPQKWYSTIVLLGVLPNLLKCYIRIKIDRIYKFDIILLPQNINRFSGSTPRVLIVVLQDKSPGVISLYFRKRLDEIYNSKKSFNYIKKALQECLLLFVGALLESFLFFLFSLVIYQIYIFCQNHSQCNILASLGVLVGALPDC